MIIALLAAAGMIAYARYNDSTNVVKRVVSTQKGEKSLFSSNLLNISEPQQTKTVSEEVTTPQYFDISIYSFDIKNPGTEYPIDIDYDLVLSFYNSAGTQALNSEQINALIGNDTIQLYEISGSSVSATPFMSINKDSSLEDRTSSRTVTSAIKEDSFRLVLPISMKNKDISIKITASPSGYTDLPNHIGAYFSIKTQTFNRIDGWRGDFNDNRNIPLSEYDGFNYSITGNGKSEGTLSWNNTLLEPNMQQINRIKKENSSVETLGTTSSIVLSLDSTDNGGRYDIQFYVVYKEVNDTVISGRSAIDSMQWSAFANQATGVVTFTEN